MTDAIDSNVCASAIEPTLDRQHESLSDAVMQDTFVDDIDSSVPQNTIPVVDNDKPITPLNFPDRQPSFESLDVCDVPSKKQRVEEIQPIEQQPAASSAAAASQSIDKSQSLVLSNSFCDQVEQELKGAIWQAGGNPRQTAATVRADDCQDDNQNMGTGERIVKLESSIAEGVKA